MILKNKEFNGVYRRRIHEAIHTYMKHRIRATDVFCNVSATDKLRPINFLFSAAMISGDELFMFYITEPVIDRKETENELKRLVSPINYSRELIEIPGHTLALHDDRQLVRIEAPEGKMLTPHVVILIPQITTTLGGLALPNDLNARVIFLDQFLGLIDEIEQADSLSEFFKYSDNIRKKSMSAYSPLDLYGSYLQSNKVLIEGAMEPDLIVLDPHWGSNYRYDSLAKFWPHYPKRHYQGHPRWWSLDEKESGKIRLISRSQIDSAIYFEINDVAVLFYGLHIKKRIDIANDMAILPFQQVQAFVEKSLTKELVPQGAGFHGWQSVGAVVKPFQWKPKFYRAGSTRISESGWSEVRQTEIFFQQAVVFLELLAVAHATPVLRLAMLPQRIKHTAGQLLGGVSRSGSYSQGRSTQGFDGFELCPELVPEALAIAREAFDNRDHKPFEEMAPIIGRLDEALARDGRFASGDKILDVAIALERMYQLDSREISRKMQTRVAWFLGDDAGSGLRETETIKRFYNTRSGIVHNKRKQNSPARNQEIFNEGFSIAKRTLFKLLREGTPDWGKIG